MARPSVLSRALGLLALIWLGSVWAAPAGVVTHLSGTLSVQKADGSARILSQLSEVDNGDTLSTEKDSYARLKFTDGGEVTLRPSSVFKLEGYAYDEATPRQDSFLVSLLKGGLRTVTGAIGKRGNREAYRMSTATATIGIRGTDFGVLHCKGNCPSRKDGTYTTTFEGAIGNSNGLGSLECGAGQTCFTGLDQPPILLPDDRGVDFTIPPGFYGDVKGGTVLDPQGHKSCVVGR